MNGTIRAIETRSSCLDANFWAYAWFVVSCAERETLLPIWGYK